MSYDVPELNAYLATVDVLVLDTVELLKVPRWYAEGASSCLSQALIFTSARIFGLRLNEYSACAS
jgi:hypothetical protein